MFFLIFLVTVSVFSGMMFSYVVRTLIRMRSERAARKAKDVE